jgi:nitrite reductase/ring-hydroxylating ferredoxin subunit
MPIGIFEIDGEYYAMLSICPHRGGELCEGPQCGTAVSDEDFRIHSARRNELVRCAWHGWEFDIRSGEALSDPGMKAKTFPVSVDGDELYVHM